ncbi:MAG: 6-bladed beta-propeller [Gemmatimonadota bacterium]|jgi:hypothetical protein
MFRVSTISMFCPGALAGLLFLLACGGEPPAPATLVTDSAGVVVVEGPGTDVPLGWTAEPVLRLAALDEEGEGFFGASEVEVLGENRIAVLDQTAKRVVLFDSDGNFLTQYGREGSGPGEFQLPWEMLPMPEGGVAVFDVMNHRLERFDAELSPLAPRPFAQVSYFGGHMAYVGSSLVLPTNEPVEEGKHPQALTAMRPGDTLEVVRYVRNVGGTIILESCGMQLMGIEPIFSPPLLWTEAPEGRAVVVATDRYEIDLYREPEFRLERRIRRNVPVIEATESMAEASVGDAMRVMTPAGERVCDAAEVVEKRGFADVVPPIARVAVSPSGTIWIARWAPKGEDPAIDILTGEGEYVGTLPPGFPFPDAFLGTDRILRVEKDALDVASVQGYRVVR